MSKFLFVASVLYVPHEIIKKVDKIIYEFVWGTATEKVKREIVNQDYNLGGLRMCSFNMCNKASKLKWIRWYLDPSVKGVWKDNLEHLCKKKNLSIFILSCFDTNELSLPLYYVNSFLQWKREI